MTTIEEEQQLPTIQKIIAILWPSFLTAGVATVLFFTAFDPREIALCMGKTVKGDIRLGAYTIGFFLFWILTSTSCALTCYFRKPCHKPKPDSNA